MRKIFLLILILGGWSWTATAQTKELTLEDGVIGQFTKFRAERIDQLQWLPGTDKLAFVGEADDEYWLQTTLATADKKEKLLSLGKLNDAMKAANKDLLTAFPALEFESATVFTFESQRMIFRYDMASHKLTQINEYQKGGAFHDYHKNHSVAYCMDNNLWVSLPGQEDQQVTNDPEGITNGQAAHRFEFGIEKGIFWSETGNKLAFYRVDETMVTEYGMYDFSTMPAGTDMIRYPMAGAKSHHAQFGIYDVKSQKTIFLKVEGDPEQYLTNIFWSPDDKYVYFILLNRDQNHSQLQQYDAATGQFIKTLYERKSDKYVQPLHAGHFLPGSTTEFVILDDPDGWMHLYHYNTDGKQIRRLTEGNWMITGFDGFDAAGKNLYFTSTEVSPIERHTYRLDLKTGQRTQVTTGKGTHFTKFQPEGKFVLDNYQSTTVANAYQVFDNKKNAVARTLLTSNNPYDAAGVKLGELRIFTIKAKDGSDLYCRMILPPNFDPNKKYPVIDYVYGGPGVQLINDVFLGAAPLWMFWCAQEGYIVFTLENRGSANRGRAFEQQTFRQLGTVEIEDQLSGVDWLKSQPYVDGSRMGIHGWSYGGFMTTNLMLRTPGTFKVGVAGGPVIDWKMYEIMYTERYMDTPQTNEKGYDKANLMNYVDKLQGKLLLIHGTSDDIVVWQHTLAFLDKAIKSGVQLDYFVYPSAGHNVRGKDRVHLMRKVLDYMMAELEK